MNQSLKDQNLADLTSLSEELKKLVNEKDKLKKKKLDSSIEKLKEKSKSTKNKYRDQRSKIETNS